MSLLKFGTGEKILEIAKSAEIFSKMWNNIEEKNQLIRCQNCHHLLSKKSEIATSVQDPTTSSMMTITINALTIKHQKIAAIITGQIKIICPVCNTVNDIS